MKTWLVNSLGQVLEVDVITGTFTEWDWNTRTPTNQYKLDSEQFKIKVSAMAGQGWDHFNPRSPK